MASCALVARAMAARGRALEVRFLLMLRVDRDSIDAVDVFQFLVFIGREELASRGHRVKKVSSPLEEVCSTLVIDARHWTISPPRSFRSSRLPTYPARRLSMCRSVRHGPTFT